MDSIYFAERSKLPHACILASPNPELQNTAALQLAAAALCEKTQNVPCGACRHCRKVLKGIHPDVSIIEREVNEKGKLRREITIGQIRDMASDAYILPNEASGKVYIIKEAELMNLNAQNAALKIFEEPPSGVMFILCAAKITQLLPTIRSRCAEITINGEEPQNEEALRDADIFLNAVATGDPVQIYNACVSLEKMDTLDALAFVRAVSARVADAVCGRVQYSGINSAGWIQLSDLMERCNLYLCNNVGVKHVMGLLAAVSLRKGAKL